MKNIVVAAVAGITLVVGGLTFGGIASGAEQTGEALFKQHCALCHVEWRQYRECEENPFQKGPRLPMA